MRSQFEFYDFVAYLIPGLLTLALLLWIPAAYVNLRFDPSQTASDALSSAAAALLILAASYALGHLVQGIGSDLEKRFNLRKSRDKDSSRIANKLLPEMNREQIINNLEAVLHLKIETDEENFPEQHKELRRLAHSLVSQEGVGRRVDLLAGLYRLHRGALVAILLALLIGSLEVVRHSISIFEPHIFAELSFYCEDRFHLVISLFSIPILLALASRIRRRVIRYFDHFEATAFREFFVWRQRTLARHELADSASPDPLHDPASFNFTTASDLEPMVREPSHSKSEEIPFESDPTAH